MSTSIRKVLAMLPSGAAGVDLALDELGQYLGENCNTDSEKARNTRHQLRDEMYCDGGVEHMRRVVDTVFSDDTVRELRKQFLPYARFNNAVKRVVNELSTLYAAPAVRSVGDESSNLRYQAILESLRFDEQMMQVNRLFNLHRALLVGVRVRELTDGTREPCIDIATPGNARAVLHPNDPTLVVGWLVRTGFRSKRTTWLRKPAWSLWTDHESMYLDESFAPLAETYQEHGLGINRWVPLTRSVSRAGFWPGEEGEDLVAAQVAIWLSNVLLLKETKSATVQPVISGDASSMTRDQASDSETPIHAPEGVGVSTIDLSMDLSMFRDTADHILQHVAANYGMSAALLNHQGVQSGEARELMRVPIRELRREQEPVFRLFERRLARVLATVLEKDAPEQSFQLDGWRIDFGEAQTPLTPVETLNLFEKKKALGLDNAIDFVRRENPDLDHDAAAAEVERNEKIKTWHMRLLREFQALSGSPGATLPAVEAAQATPATTGETRATTAPTVVIPTVTPT